MPDRPLSAEEQALWSRVASTVHPLAGRGHSDVPVPSADAAMSVTPSRPAPTLIRKVSRPGASTLRPAVAADTLDGGWDRRLRRGTVAPERSLDLHGHTLASAHAALEAALDLAVAEGTRLLLVVTGKPPRSGEARRGLIRASIFDWLAQSRHAAAIAAVRNAHPRHGGSGALYLVLRRKRGG